MKRFQKVTSVMLSSLMALSAIPALTYADEVEQDYEEVYIEEVAEVEAEEVEAESEDAEVAETETAEVEETEAIEEITETEAEEVTETTEAEEIEAEETVIDPEVDTASTSLPGYVNLPVANVTDEGSQILIWGWNEEFPYLVNEYWGSDYELYTYESYLYQTYLDQALASGENAPDLFVCDADYAKKYINSDYTLPVNYIGIDYSELTNMYNYTLQMGANNGNVIKGLAWQACPCGVFYNRTLAGRYLGVSDPASVAPYFATWDAFLNTARTVNARSGGAVKAISGFEDLFNLFSSQRTMPWINNNQIVRDPAMDQYLDIAGILMNENLTFETPIWSDDWSANMANETVLSYWGPMWLAKYSMGLGDDYGYGNSNPTSGDWGMVNAPESFFWGGTWIMASSYCDMKASAAEIMRAVAINETNLTDMARQGEFVNSTRVMSNIASNPSYNIDWLGGQNPIAVLLSSANDIDYTYIGDNESVINAEYSNVAFEYLCGDYPSRDVMYQVLTIVLQELGILDGTPGPRPTGVPGPDSIALNSTNFRDDTFRDVLSDYDTNNNGYLDKSEIFNITYLQIYSSGITTLDGIKNLTSLIYLDASDNNLTSIDVSGMTKLTYLYCGYNNNLTSINVSGATNLSSVQCRNTSITSLDLSNLPRLENVDCGDNTSLATINLTGSDNLVELECGNDNLNTLNLAGHSNLTSVNCDGNGLTSLDVSGCFNLYYLVIINNNLRSVNISDCTYLVRLINDSTAVHDVYTDQEVYSTSYDEDEVWAYISMDRTTALVSNSPTSTVTPTPNPTAAPIATATPTPKDQVTKFVERVYLRVLNRPGDLGGIAYYVNQLKSGKMTGAQVARVVLDSPEFANRGLSNEQFLRVLYSVFFDRNADQGGLNYYLNQMKGGRTRSQVIADFVNSTEWANICLEYGIESGSNKTPTITVTPAPEVIAFATRLYTTCLGRAGEQSGINYWATRLANRRATGTEAAQFFFFGSEFTNKGLDNREFLVRLYRTMYGREADNGGLNYWLGKMSNGMTRAQVFANFANAPEWIRICSDYGIRK